MITRFSALALRGEAFLLETTQGGRQWSVLVDGGQDGPIKNRDHPLVKAIKKVSPHLSQIDIAICTHNDADHAGGFPSFLDEWLKAGKTIAEVWLPWKWSAALPMVLTDPDGLTGRLALGAFEAAFEIEKRIGSAQNGRLAGEDGERRISGPESVIREIGSQLLREGAAGVRSETVQRDRSSEQDRMHSYDRYRANQIPRALGLPGTGHETARNLLEETGRATESLTRRGAVYLEDWLGAARGPISFRASALLSSTLETAERIRAIADTALRKGILIRWFDFDAFENGDQASGGVEAFLTPVNAVEMAEPRSEVEPVRLFFSLKLSEQNVESLVFQRIESESEPGVIFLGDSRLAFGVARPDRNFPKPRILPTRRPIITAAHHGSRVNDRAYEVLDDWLGIQLASESYFIRNGGMWKQTLGKYLSKPERRCAQCQQCFISERQQMVVVDANSGDWSWPPVAKTCGKPMTNSVSVLI